MKVYNYIKDLNSVIADMKADLNYVKDKTRKRILIERINKLIDVRNSYESVIIYKFKIDSLETLIYSCVKSMLMNDKGHLGNDFDLEMYLKTLGEIINNGSEQKKSELISYLDNNYDNKILKDYQTHNDIFKYGDDMKNKPTYKHWNNVLNEFVGVLKTDILWKKR